ncbi:hypothetical protein B2J93_322 [Marssonina coronariae]|uniref:Uncharacterized protein n=1 Tax=Diplocarpon coronariae TaxID=2795749 RepID=A0A218Z1B2_9HELO|nr:hypothetical protein B2J93_322 [Marssonina coronariae]
MPCHTTLLFTRPGRTGTRTDVAARPSILHRSKSRAVTRSGLAAAVVSSHRDRHFSRMPPPHILRGSQTLAPPARGSWDAGASATAAAKMSSGLRAAMSPSRGQMQLLLRYAESSGPAPSSTRSPYPSSRHKPLVRPAEMDRMIRIWNHRPPDPEIRDTCVCKCTQPSLAAAVVLDLVEDKACREGWQYLAAAVHSSVIRAATRCKPG